MSKATDQITSLEGQLDSLEPATRWEALQALVALSQDGAAPSADETDVVNMHLHTFYSFNAMGHSPSTLAWLAKRHGFRVAGIVDFDVLDGVDEFLGACDLLGVRGSAGIETRVFIPEYSNQEINSLGEPGVCYHMGVGFASSQVPGAVADILADLRRRAAERNREILTRVNDYLDPVAIDYEQDVLPLTPAGSPTERHLVVAYIRAAEALFKDPAAFWSGKLGVAPAEMSDLMLDSPGFQTLIRSRLMKRGGAGYVEPDSGMFPTLEAYQRLIAACGSLSCAAWLDGTTTTEENIEEWLDFLVDKGAVTLNIIPDRNWNIPDSETRRIKVQKLYQVVELAQEMDLPLIVGTEMNSFGQRLVDDFDSPEMLPLWHAFVDGAFFIYGHTALHRALGLGYHSQWATTYLPARRQRNDFYAQAGRLIPPGRPGLERLGRLDVESPPSRLLAALESWQPTLCWL